MFKVKDYMTKDVICTEKDATISEVLELMKEHGIHRVPVVENQKLVRLRWKCWMRRVFQVIREESILFVARFVKGR